MTFKNKCLLSLMIVSAFTMVSCGKKDQSQGSKTETQVVAKVNGDEISIHQVNFQLSRLAQNSKKQLNEAQSKEAAQQILTRLVDQQLLKQQAVETKLDRDPRVLQIIETSKNEILAQAFLEQLLSKAAKPTTTQVDAFYKENPALFENRRVFRLQELAVKVDKEKYSEIEDKVKSFKNMNEIAVWLKEQNYQFNANSNVRAAEQLPLDFLKQIQPLKDGEVVVVQTAQSVNVVLIAASQSMPIARDKATPIIEQYFLNQNKTALAQKEMAALKEKAKIEYVGAFANMKKEAQVNSTENPKTDKDQTSIENSGKAANDAVEKAEQATKPKPDSTQSSMDKGLAGF